MNCQICNKKLGGTNTKKTAKTGKRPERAFGGVLCHQCVERIAKYQARLKAGTITQQQVDLRYKPFVKQLKTHEKTSGRTRSKSKPRTKKKTSK
jgi:uncharacterized protein YlaI